MAIEKHRNTGNTTAIKAAGVVVFLLFTFIYTYYIQCDLLAMIQYAWSHYQTHYNRIVGAYTITAVLAALSAIVALFTRFPLKLSALVYLPALTTLGLLTGVKLTHEGNVHTSLASCIEAILLIAAFIVISINTKKYFPFFHEKKGERTDTACWAYNTLIFTLMITIVFGLGNTDRQLHTRLAAERLCIEKRYDEALNTGLPQHDDDSSLPMLRALALANTGELGEKLFSYNIPTRTTACNEVTNSQTTTKVEAAGSFAEAPAILPFQNGTSFLTADPYPVWQTIGFVPRNRYEAPETYLKRELRRHTACKPAQDYLLCTYLLEGKLAEFAHTMPKFYDMHQTHLPEHYSEALVLYNDIMHGTDTLVASACKIMPAHTADYNDFKKLARSQKDPTLRTATLRDSYAGTYWFYYWSKSAEK